MGCQSRTGATNQYKIKSVAVVLAASQCVQKLCARPAPSSASVEVEDRREAFGDLREPKGVCGDFGRGVIGYFEEMFNGEGWVVFHSCQSWSPERADARKSLITHNP